MALTDESNGTGMVMPVAPMGGFGGGMPYPVYANGFGSGNNSFGGDWGWIILLLLLAGNGGWGMGGGFGGGDLYPWLNNSQNINGGFRDQMLNSSLTGIQSAVTSGFGDMQTALCGGFAGVNATINGAQNALAQQLYTNQIAGLERSFGLQSQLAQCCCDNRLASANLEATVARENCADREALNYATRDIINSQTAGVQKILDTLCQDKIDAKNDTIAQLRSELLYARGQASQDVQTAAIQAGQRALANEVEQYVLPTPRPAYIVANPNCCTNNCGCGSF